MGDDWHGWAPERVTREEFEADRRGVNRRAWDEGINIEVWDGDVCMGSLGPLPNEVELREIVRKDAERIRELKARVRELEAQVRRLQRSDGPMLGPEPPPRWPCPKCGKGTWMQFGGDRVCYDQSCTGLITVDEWSSITHDEMQEVYGE